MSHAFVDMLKFIGSSPAQRARETERASQQFGGIVHPLIRCSARFAMNLYFNIWRNVIFIHCPTKRTGICKSPDHGNADPYHMSMERYFLSPLPGWFDFDFIRYLIRLNIDFCVECFHCFASAYRINSDLESRRQREREWERQNQSAVCWDWISSVPGVLRDV